MSPSGGLDGPDAPGEQGAERGRGAWRNPFSAAAGGPDGSGTEVPAAGAVAGEEVELPPEPVRAALVLPLHGSRAAERVADALAVAGIGLDLVPVEGVGLVVVLGEVLQPAAEARAQLVSRTLRRVPVTLLLATAEQAVAQLWSSGARGADPRAGLLLASWPDDVLALLLGRRQPADDPSTVSSAGRGRWSSLLRTLRPGR